MVGRRGWLILSMEKRKTRALVESVLRRKCTKLKCTKKTRALVESDRSLTPSRYVAVALDIAKK